MNSSFENHQSQMSSLGNDYSLYQGFGDPYVISGASTAESKFGLAQEIAAEIALALQSLLGLNNQGVAAAVGTLGAVQTYGVPGVDRFGQGGSISGRSIASFHAARALQNELTSNYVGPTGLPNERAAGLNPQEVAIALTQALKSGRQFSGGPVLQEVVVDNAFKQKQINEGQEIFRKTGDKRALLDAQDLEVGKSTFSFTGPGKDKLLAATDDMVATLSSLKEIFGSDALLDLDRVTSSILGTSLSGYGGRNARLRLAQIKSMANNYFGGDMNQAARFSQTNAQFIAAGIGGAGMDPAEAFYRYGEAGSRAAAIVDRAATAVVAGDQARSALFTGPDGRPLFNPRKFEDVAGPMSRGAGIMVDEEKSLGALMFALKGGTGSAAETANLEELRRRYIEAGGDPDKLAAVRKDAEAAVYRVTGGSSVGAVINDAGGWENVKDEVAADLSETTAVALENRYRDQVRDKLYRNTQLRTQDLGGLSAKEAAEFGLGAASLSATDAASLRGALGNTEAVDKLLGNQSVIEALKSSGVDIDTFRNVAINKANDATMIQSLKIARTVNGFVAAGDKMDRDAKTNLETLRDLQGGSTPRGDALLEFMQGLQGKKTWTGKEIIDAAPDERVRKLTLKDGNLEASEGNAKILRDILGDSGPKDAAALSEMLKDGGLLKLKGLLSEKGVLSADNTTLKFLGEEYVGEARSEAFSKSIKEQLAYLTGTPTDKLSLTGSEDEIRQQANQHLNRRLMLPGASGHTRLAELASNALRGVYDPDSKTYKTPTDEAQRKLLALGAEGVLTQESRGELDKVLGKLRKDLSAKLSNLESSDKKDPKAISSMKERIDLLDAVQESIRDQSGSRSTSAENVTINASNVKINNVTRPSP